MSNDVLPVPIYDGHGRVLTTVYVPSDDGTKIWLP